MDGFITDPKSKTSDIRYTNGSIPGNQSASQPADCPGMDYTKRLIAAKKIPLTIIPQLGLFQHQHEQG